MSKFNLEDYETVEERIKKFYAEYPDGRIVTENLTTLEDRSVSTWVCKSYVYLTAGDQAAGLPRATGLAFEVDGQGMAQKTAALETAETSSIGRALANAGWSGNRRASRTEMEKAERGITPAPVRNWIAEAEALYSVDDLRLLWNEAKAANAPASTLAKVKERANQVATGVSK